MAEWKFGTVLESASAVVMLIGRTKGRYKTTDRFGNVPGPGEWIGLNLVDKGITTSCPYGKPGETTWLGLTDWAVLDE